MGALSTAATAAAFGGTTSTGCPSPLDDGEPWQLVGPFPTSAHLLSPGADPNAAFGELSPTASPSLPSELCDGGRATWHTAYADEHGRVGVRWPCVREGAISEDLGATVLSSAFGWAVRNFTLPDTSGNGLRAAAAVSCGGAVTYYLDGEEMVGDPYALATWWTPDNAWLRWPLELAPGSHELRVRVRGGGGRFACRIECLPEPRRLRELRPTSPSPFNPGLVDRAPDVVGGRLASSLLSFPVVAAAGSGAAAASGPAMLSVVAAGDCRVLSTGKRYAVLAQLAGAGELGIHPGQAMPVPIHLAFPEQQDSIACGKGDQLLLAVELRARFPDGVEERLEHTFRLACLGPLEDAEPFVFSFLDMDGSVQYASAVPPAPLACPPAGCPVVLATHGAGVDASSPTWTKSLPAMAGAWLLFPSNRDKFGYDWQGAGLWDGLAALEALVASAPGVPPHQIAALAADPWRLLFTGHSMGGHGCMVFATRMPDRALGAACAAGWIRFDHYQPEWSALDSSFIDPYLAYLLSAAVAGYHTDFLAAHLAGIPFLARMGQLDEDVNPWNLRRFVRVLDQVNQTPGSAQLSEVPGMPHWFDSIMNGEPMMAFFNARLDGGAGAKPSLPSAWRVKHVGVGGASRGGVAILQVHSPFVQAWINVEPSRGQLTLTTANVRRISVCEVPQLDVPHGASAVAIDGAAPLPALSCSSGEHYCQAERTSSWAVCQDESWRREERNQWNAGPMRHVLQGRLWLVYGTQQTPEPGPSVKAMRTAALTIANKLFMRGHGLAHVLSDADAVQTLEDKGAAALRGVNVVLLGGTADNAASARLLPLTTAARSSLIYHPPHSSGSAAHFAFGGRNYTGCVGLLLHGLLHLREIPGSSGGRTGAARSLNSMPLLAPGEASVLAPPSKFALIAGLDDTGMGLAARAFPVEPNSHVPDFLVLGEEAAWLGAGGVLAAGYLGNEYEYRPDLSYPR